MNTGSPDERQYLRDIHAIRLALTRLADAVEAIASTDEDASHDDERSKS